MSNRKGEKVVTKGQVCLEWRLEQWWSTSSLALSLASQRNLQVLLPFHLLHFPPLLLLLGRPGKKNERKKEKRNELRGNFFFRTRNGGRTREFFVSLVVFFMLSWNEAVVGGGQHTEKERERER